MVSRALAVLAAAAIAAGSVASRPWDNGLARTPPMGWNSWNHFACNVSEQLIKETADAIAASGLAAAASSGRARKLPASSALPR